MTAGVVQLALTSALAALLQCGAQGSYPTTNGINPLIGIAPAPGPASPAGAGAARAPGAALRLECTEDHQKEIEHAAAFSYAASGFTWDLDEKWVCTKGKKQSPINVPAAGPNMQRIMNKFRIHFGTGSASDAELLVLPVFAVELLANFTLDGFQVPVCDVTASPPDVGCLNAKPSAHPIYVNVTAKNLHFHAVSEHAHDGRLFPLEAHLVTMIPNTTISTCPPSGCLVVFGQIFSYGFDGQKNAFLDSFLPALQETGQSCTPIEGTVNITSMFSINHSYITYRGSLTTPPCTEGVTWVLLNTPQTMSPAQQIKIQNAMAGVRHEREFGVRTNNRALQPLNNRTILYSGDPVDGYIAPV